MASPELRFRILGPLEVEVRGEPLRLASARQRAILGILLLDANRVVSTDTLIDAIWGEEYGETTLATLQVHVSKLRSALASRVGKQPIDTTDPGYLIRATDYTLDLLAFEQAIGTGRRLDADGLPDAAAREYRHALDLWRGRPLSDLADIAHIDRAADRLELAQLEAISGWTEAELKCARHAEVLGQLRIVVDEHPYDERLRAFLMLALYRSGRQADALATYHDLRRGLDEELGLEPGPDLRVLEAQILQHDPALKLPTPDAGPATRRVTDGGAAIALLRVGDREIDLEASVTTIGRASDRTVVLSDASVSRRHAEIRRTAGGFTLVDRGSTNGTRLNGELISQAEIHDGDLILAGEVAMTFEVVRSDPA